MKSKLLSLELVHDGADMYAIKGTFREYNFWRTSYRDTGLFYFISSMGGEPNWVTKNEWRFHYCWSSKKQASLRLARLRA